MRRRLLLGCFADRVSKAVALQKPLNNQLQQVGPTPLQGQVSRDVACFAEAARCDLVPNVGSEKDFQPKATQWLDQAIHAEQCAERIGLKLRRRRKGNVKPVDDQPYVEVLLDQDCV
jgi:hypothetical protein